MFFVDDSQNVVILQGLLMVTERLNLCLRSFPMHFWWSCLHALILKCSHAYLRSTNCKNACSSTDNETHRTVWTCTCLYRLDMLMMNFFLTGLVGTSSLPKSCTDKWKSLISSLSFVIFFRLEKVVLDKHVQNARVPGVRADRWREASEYPPLDVLVYSIETLFLFNFWACFVQWCVRLSFE